MRIPDLYLFPICFKYKSLHNFKIRKSLFFLGHPVCHIEPSGSCVRRLWWVTRNLPKWSSSRQQSERCAQLLWGPQGWRTGKSVCRGAGQRSWSSRRLLGGRWSLLLYGWTGGKWWRIIITTLKMVFLQTYFYFWSFVLASSWHKSIYCYLHI